VNSGNRRQTSQIRVQHTNTTQLRNYATSESLLSSPNAKDTHVLSISNLKGNEKGFTFRNLPQYISFSEL
jgi:hypothetical protein